MGGADRVSGAGLRQPGRPAARTRLQKPGGGRRRDAVGCCFQRRACSEAGSQLAIRTASSWRTGGTRPKRGSRLVFVLARASGRRRRGWLVVSEVSSPGDAGEAAVTLLLAIQEFVANGWRSGRQRQSAASPERAAVAVSVGVALAFQSDSLARLQQPAGWFRPRCCDCFASPDSASIALFGRSGVSSSCCAAGIARIRSRARDRGR